MVLLSLFLKHILDIGKLTCNLLTTQYVQTELYIQCLMLSATFQFHFPLLLSPFINEETEIQRSEACFPKY